MSKSLYTLLLAALTCQFGFGQAPIWSPVNEKNIEATGLRQIVPQKYQPFRADLIQLRSALRSAPHESQVLMNNSTVIISLPLPDGTVGRFRIIESPVMDEVLQASFPHIRTYNVKGIDDVYASGKLDWNDFGFHAMVFSPSGDFFVDPYCLGNTKDYISYYTADFAKDPSQMIPEFSPVSEPDVDINGAKKRPGTSPQSTTFQNRPPASCAGATLRSYRLAVACTGEYAVAATGTSAPTVSQILSKVVTSVNRVDGVYEKEVAVSLNLVSTTTLVLYPNASTDPFTGTANTNATTLIGLSQSVITSSVGTANFDIGHTFSTGGGGLANLGCVCQSSQKAKGITGSPSPVGDPYDIDYVAHEMGHQFGGNHTFNAVTGNCNGNRDGAAAVEPGSGVTIMAYAGICSSNNIAGNSIPYFHGFSYDEIYNFVSNGGGSGCAVTSTTGNNPPQVNAVAAYAVPKSTPFSITGSATDPDNDPITYSWEEMDLGPGAGGNWNSGNAPYFRSYPPVTTGTRLFPRLNVVQSNNYTGTAGEYLPGIPQMLNFRLTARDNKVGGGGVCYTSAQVQVDTAGPFVVMYPSATGISWAMGTQKTILWDPAHTDQPPVACDSVRILISYNSGVSYTTLIGSAANFGFYTIAVPTLSNTISTCRIRIEAKGNTFYDIGNFDFTISTDPTAGVSDISRNNALSLGVWPNPANDHLMVSAAHLNTTEITSIKLYDLLGREHLSLDAGHTAFIHQSFDLSSLQPGVYFVSVQNAGNLSVQRFVKE